MTEKTLCEQLASDKAAFHAFLSTNVAVVTFTKRDGTERVMKCTLMESIVPKDEKTSQSETKRKLPDTNLAVYDIEAKGWRSFILASVTKIEKDQ